MNKSYIGRIFLSVILLILPAALFAQVPKSNHVVVVLEENHGYSSVIGNSAMPYFNSLATKNALATQYYANTHPSIGNYLMMTTGQIITNNDGYSSTIAADNIVRHLLTGGKTWKSYAEDLPSVGYTGGNRYPYIRHHNPLSYFSDVVNSSVQKLNLVPFTHFASDLANNQLPDFSFVVPNMHHNAHDCPTAPTGCTDSQKLAAADAWLKANIAPLLANSEFQQDGILILVFDEAATSDSTHGGGRVATVVVGPGVKKGFKSTVTYQHQNLLRTVLDALEISSHPGASATAKDMADLFTGSGATSSGCTASAVGVTVCAPANGSTVGSPVRFYAAAKSTHPITAMRIYVDGVSKYVVNAGAIDTSLSIASGTHSVMMQAWDSAGAVFKTPLSISVP